MDSPSSLDSASDTPDDRSKKSSVMSLFVCLVVVSFGASIGAIAAGANEFFAYMLGGVLLIASVITCATFQRKHRNKHPKTQADRREFRVDAILFGGFVAVEAFLLWLSPVWALLPIIVLLAWLGLYSIYGAVLPFAKDRKSAIILAIGIAVFLAAARGCSDRNSRTRPANSQTAPNSEY